ncbi:FkbM family methyltransferase [Methanocorpusculum sp.]|nr:FkbM family methyltransferase [Methanocorpusculum sp.]
MTECTSKQQYENIEEFYQSFSKDRTDEQESVGFSLGTFCTKIWNKTPFRKSKTITRILWATRSKIIHNYDNISRANNYSDNISRNEEKYKKLYTLLSDEKSKRTMICVLRFRADGNYETLHSESDYTHNQYFDKDIMKFSDAEVFADCGGFVGDTTSLFISRVHDFSKIYIYEPNPINHQKATQLLTRQEAGKIDKIIIRKAGVGIETISSKISLSGASSHVSRDGDCDIQIVSLDEDIQEPITFIKMDVEGFELDALKGARNHILAEKPKLAICVYHKPDDLWEIPEYILSLNPKYKLYLRQYMFGNGENPWETVLYAV